MKLNISLGFFFSERGFPAGHSLWAVWWSPSELCECLYSINAFILVTAAGWALAAVPKTKWEMVGLQIKMKYWVCGG